MEGTSAGQHRGARNIQLLAACACCLPPALACGLQPIPLLHMHTPLTLMCTPLSAHVQVLKLAGDPLIGGTINTGSAMLMRAKRVGSETTLAQVCGNGRPCVRLGGGGLAGGCLSCPALPFPAVPYPAMP